VPDVTARVLPSVLDRLLAGSAADATQSRGQQLAELRNAVRRDLEALLNAHCYAATFPPGMPELERSLLRYGIPDFLTINAGAPEVREEFRRAVEESIRTFEPRFKSVSVALVGAGDADDRTMRFRVEALMYAEPAPEVVSFDSRLDPSSHSFTVLGERDG
jgi:type VI secretion system protein ImpF